MSQSFNITVPAPGTAAYMWHASADVCASGVTSALFVYAAVLTQNSNAFNWKPHPSHCVSSGFGTSR